MSLIISKDAPLSSVSVNKSLSILLALHVVGNILSPSQKLIKTLHVFVCTVSVFASASFLLLRTSFDLRRSKGR